MDLKLEFLNNATTSDIAQYILLAIAIILFLSAIFIGTKGKIDINKIVLKDIADGKKDKECALWNYGKYDYSCVPYNDTWKQWISSGNGKYGLVVTVNRPDLTYYNFGEEFYFVNLENSKKILIPIGDKARKEKVGSSFYDGMVVRLMPKTS